MTSQDTSAASDFQNFRKLGIPVSLIWRRKDNVTPLWQGEQLQKLMPGSRLAVMEGVGHIPYIEDPETFNKVLLEDLR